MDENFSAMRLFFLIFYLNLLLIKNSGIAQSADSLILSLKSITNDSLKVNTLNSIAFETRNTDPDTSIYFSKTALLLAEKNNYLYGIAESELNLGRTYLLQGELIAALKNCSDALILFDKLLPASTNKANIEKQRGNTFNEIGKIKLSQAAYPEALKVLLTALEIRLRLGDKKDISYTQNNLGIVYYKQADYANALKYYNASLKIREELGDKSGIAYSNNNIGIVYQLQLDKENAERYYLVCLKICKEIDDKAGVAMAYQNIASVKLESNNLNEALEYYQTAQKIYDETGDKYGSTFGYSSIANTLIKLKKYAEAKKYLNTGIALSKEIGSLDNLSSMYASMAAVDSIEGRYKESLANYKLYVEKKDSIFNESNTKKMVQTEMIYEFEKKEAEIKAEQDIKNAVAQKELQRQKIIRNSFIGGFAIVIIFAGVFFRQRNKIKKGKKMSDKLLLNILPEEVAEELKAKGSADARQFSEVTVMFTDFKGFTKVAEKLTPTELVAEIHTCFKAFDNIISKYNIEKIKTIGDSYMCAGGLPIPNSTNAVNVVAAALEIQAYMKKRFDDRKTENKETFEIRIGINTGPVVAGIVGVKKFAYDIWGDTVNIASRMESSGEAGKINISDITYKLVKEKFKCTARGKIEAKNKGEIEMYYVEGMM